MTRRLVNPNYLKARSYYAVEDERSQANYHHNSRNASRGYELVYDPDGLYRAGATFPTIDLPMKGDTDVNHKRNSFPVGTIFRKIGNAKKCYVFDGRFVRPAGVNEVRDIMMGNGVV